MSHQCIHCGSDLLRLNSTEEANGIEGSCNEIPWKKRTVSGEGSEGSNPMEEANRIEGSSEIKYQMPWDKAKELPKSNVMHGGARKKWGEKRVGER